MKDDFFFFQLVLKQGIAGGYQVTDSVGEADMRSDLHASGDLVDLRGDPFIPEISFQGVGIRGGDSFAFKKTDLSPVSGS